MHWSVSRIALHTLGVIQRAFARVPDEPSAQDNYAVLHNAATGQRLYMSGAQRARILGTSRENDASQLDVIDALAILECALFGAATFT